MKVSIRKTQEEFISEIYSLNPNLKILNEYVNSNGIIKCYCEKHNVYFEKIASRLLKYPSCKQCSSENYSRATSMTYDDFLAKFNKIHKNIEIVDEFVNTMSDLTAKCLVDGHIWTTRGNRLLNGHGCPKCAGQHVTNDDFLNKVKEANLNFLPLEKYKNTKTKLLCKCLIDGHEWKCLPNDLFKISGCPQCKKEKMIKLFSKSNDDFVHELYIKNKDVEILGEYKNIKTKIKTRCLIHDHIWDASPNHLLNGHGCPQCVESVGEKKIRNILENKNILFTTQKTFDGCADKNKLRFDFFLDEYNICIEYNGKQHYEPIKHFGGNESFIETERRDNIKREFCKLNNIELIEIKYTEYKNIENILLELFQTRM